MERKMSRKLVHIVLLLISSMLIATASAAIYNIMYMDVVVTPKPAKVYFTTSGAGDATKAGTTVSSDGTYVTFALKGWGNATRIYEDIVHIKNNDTENVECTINVTQVTNVANLQVLNFTIAGQELNALTVGNKVEFTITSSSEVTVGVQLKWKPSPGSDAAVVTLQLTVKGGSGE